MAGLVRVVVDTAPGNAMTTSTLSACMFSLMCFALPTETGRTILQGPNPRNLIQMSNGQAQGRQLDEDDESVTLELPGWAELDDAADPPPAN